MPPEDLGGRTPRDAPGSQDQRARLTQCQILPHRPTQPAAQSVGSDEPFGEHHLMTIEPSITPTAKSVDQRTSTDAVTKRR